MPIKFSSFLQCPAQAKRVPTSAGLAGKEVSRNPTPCGINIAGVEDFLPPQSRSARQLPVGGKDGMFLSWEGYSSIGRAPQFIGVRG